MTRVPPPLSREELAYLRDAVGGSLPALLADVMRRKLLRRTRRHKGELSMKDLEDVERRAGAAYAELAEAHHFDHVLPNHDGEDSDNWDAFYFPLGDARRTLLAFAALLRGETPPAVERWKAEDVPAPGPSSRTG